MLLFPIILILVDFLSCMSLAESLTKTSNACPPATILLSKWTIVIRQVHNNVNTSSTTKKPLLRALRGGKGENMDYYKRNDDRKV